MDYQNRSVSIPNFSKLLSQANWGYLLLIMNDDSAHQEREKRRGFVCQTAHRQQPSKHKQNLARSFRRHQQGMNFCKEVSDQLEITCLPKLLLHMKKIPKKSNQRKVRILLKWEHNSATTKHSLIVAFLLYISRLQLVRFSRLTSSSLNHKTYVDIHSVVNSWGWTVLLHYIGFSLNFVCYPSQLKSSHRCIAQLQCC